ncbi:MAG: chromate transporter [Candidatus Eremiobacteraeota bacterium]|nr:chromate transporter [Candidatus Eremiobacteraeota bacterium]
MREVFLTFLRLGSTSFGGPVAHLAYFRRTFVEERGWLDEASYARVVAFCSVLPGPTSSQVGMLVGLTRGGPAGAFLAWLGFTAPSAILMALIAAALTSLGVLTGAGAHSGVAAATSAGTAAGEPMPPTWLGGLLGGLFAAAAAVVAQAVLGLRRALVTDAATALIAAGAAALALALRGAPGLQWLPIAAGAALGALALRGEVQAAQGLPIRVPRAVALAAAALVVALVALTLVPHASPAPRFAATLVRAGALVFGGGHVVLPLLETTVRDGLLDERTFLAGYGAVQAMPGPLFTFASFLGEANRSPLHGALGALLATVLIFAPSFALIFALAPVWNRIVASPHAAGALRGANAAVVGLLAAVLYDPILTGLAGHWARMALALAAFAVLVRFKLPPWVVVVGAAALGALARA